MATEDREDPATPNRSSRVVLWRFFHYLPLFLVVGLGFSIISMNTLRYFWAQNQNIIRPLRGSNNIMWLVELSRTETQSWISPPKNLLHNKNDAELFWRASFVPQTKNYPDKRVPKIAFMFLTKGPLPLAPRRHYGWDSSRGMRSFTRFICIHCLLMLPISHSHQYSTRGKSQLRCSSFSTITCFYVHSFVIANLASHFAWKFSAHFVYINYMVQMSDQVLAVRRYIC